MRKDFQLPEEDVDSLENSGFAWQTVTDGGSHWVILDDYPVPAGYNVDKVKVALKIDAGYPVSQIDMAYFYPALSKLKGAPINALASQPIQGRIWQRWSRHRTGENPWRPGLDNISTHLNMVTYWLERELLK